MIGIPDWSNEPLSSSEEIAARNAEIDTEIAAFHAKREQQVLAAFNEVPSYVERFKLEASE